MLRFFEVKNSYYRAALQLLILTVNRCGVFSVIYFFFSPTNRIFPALIDEEIIQSARVNTALRHV